MNLRVQLSLLTQDTFVVRNKLRISANDRIKYFIEFNIVVCEVPLFVRFEEAMYIFWVDIRRDDASNLATMHNDN
jgi:hypothetical protein